MSEYYGVLCRSVDNYGFVDTDEPTRYYAGNGVWDNILGNMHTFTNKEEAEIYAQTQKKRYDIVHEFHITEKKLFKARLEGK